MKCILASTYVAEEVKGCVSADRKICAKRNFSWKSLLTLSQKLFLRSKRSFGSSQGSSSQQFRWYTRKFRQFTPWFGTPSQCQQEENVKKHQTRLFPSQISPYKNGFKKVRLLTCFNSCFVSWTSLTSPGRPKRPCPGPGRPGRPWPGPGRLGRPWPGLGRPGCPWQALDSFQGQKTFKGWPF